MSWFSRPSGESERPNQRDGYRQPVDIPVQLEVAGMQLPVNATIVNISITGCRLRSWIVLERGAPVAFDWHGTQAGGLRLAGKIVSRSPAAQGPAFEYGVSFSGLSEARKDALAREIVAAQRRAAMEHAKHKSSIALLNADTSNRRNAFRAHVEMDVALRLDDRPALLKAQATDISAGGLRVVCDYPLRIGDLLVVRFRLPDDVLSIYPAKPVEEMVITPFGPRRRQSPARRPFEEMSIRSRVQSRLTDSHGRAAFGIAFVEIDAYTREEIARFIHTAQLHHLQKNGNRETRI